MNSQTTELQIAVEEPRSWARRLTITVPAARVARERKDVARRLGQQVRLPGFRQGKVPPHLIEQRYAAAIEQEALERLVQAAYKEALEQQQLSPISQGEVENVDYQAGADLTFNVEFEVRPEIELSRIGGFTVERSAPTIGDDEVETVLARVRQQHAAWAPLEGVAPVNGDRVVVEITPLEGPEAEAGGTARQYEIVLGDDQAMPAVEEAIRTLPKGEEGEFDVELPEQESEEEGATRQERIRIRTVEVMRPELPALDDDFARSLGDFEDMDGLRARIRADLEQEAEAEAERDVRRQLLDQILEANEFEVPDSLINRYLDQLIRPRPDADAERMAETRRLAHPAAEQALRRTMVIERVAELEGLHATSAEVDERVEEIAERGGRSPGEVWSQLQKSGRLAVIEEEITEDKVFAYLKAQSTIA